MKNVEDLYPLSPTQSGMLFQVLRDEDPELYFEQVRADLVGGVDPASLQAAFQQVTDRHPALRTAVVWQGLDQPLQVVRSKVDIEIDSIELAGATDDDLAELAAGRRRRAFTLADAPLQRIALIDCGGGRSHLIWEFHHIICDGWSAAIVLDEVLSFLDGRPVASPSTPFRNYLAWYRSQDGAAAADYWRRLLDGASAPTPIALPRATPSSAFLAGEHNQAIAGDDLDRLQAFARSQRITLNTLIQAAWAVIQSTYSGLDDVVFGVTTSGRPADLDHVHDIVGMFLNTLPMRVEADPNRRVGPWLSAIQSQQLASDEHSSASLADIHRQVGINAGNDLFDTVLIFENFPQPERRPDAKVTAVNKTVFEQTNYPLTLMVGVEGDLKLNAHFDRHRFDPASIERLMAQFRHVLLQLPTAIRVGELEVLRPADAALIESAQGMAVVSDGGKTVIEGLISVADRNPNGVALIEGERQVGFGELIDRARGVAAKLERLGVAPESPVGIALPRSIEMVVAMVGTLLAGAAYVPLDPRYPAARLQLMVETSGATVVLTGAGVSVPVRDHTTVIDVADIAPLRGGPSPVSPATADSTMVLTFTSGSTGVPKGVKVHHAGVMNRLRWQWREYPVVDDEVFPAKTTLGFVDHLWEIWGGLLAGRPVLLIDDDTVADPDRFIETLGHAPVRRVSMVPSLLDLLLDHAPDLASRLPNLRWWSVSGEALGVRTARRFRSVLPDASLFNLYGMSEASQDATFIEIDRSVELADSVPIGRPIDSMAVHVLDRHARPVPVGVPGELYVSGIGVSPGYWQRPDLTEERFVANPAVTDPADAHARMYRTGDLGRRRPDGGLEYLGRDDDQVKIRGVRIELGDVETALASAEGVERAVVDGRPGPGGTVLVAYLVGSWLDPAAIRGHAADRLPEVMIPSHFVPIVELPLLPNGKVDRSGLPDPAPMARPAGETVAATTDDQQRMLAVWRNVLEQPDLQPDDNFFDVGGHSMLAMSLVSRIKTELDLIVGLSQLLESGTARSLADALSASTDHDVGFDSEPAPPRYLVCMRPYDPSLDNLFVIHGAGGDVLTFRALGAELEGELNVIGVQSAGVDGVSPMHTGRSQMVEEYLEEIRNLQPEGPYLLAGFSTGGVIGSAMAERLQSAGADVTALILFDTYHPAVEPRPIPAREHLGQVLRRPAYLVERVWGRISARRDRIARERALAPEATGPVPFEVRKWQITANNIELWQDYAPPPITVPLVVASAEGVADIWEGMVTPDRGWAATAADLRIVAVPGEHMTLLEPQFAPTLVRRLRPVLDSLLTAHA
ncbi:MAG: amino acid adenylation domain-containing protein [Acidimicrobiales bacterium]|nr:amino acid adenylation domain-containing protein [Acidimicrobiales bacterium]